MKNCDRCGQSPELCHCAPPPAERYCGVCAHAPGRPNLTWVGMPNPFGADRGQVFSHWQCKDENACAQRRGKLDSSAVQTSK